MENEPIHGSDGYYCICIFGISSLSNDELNELFSKYGKIVSIKRACSNSLGFVRYQEYSEAKLAIDSMKDHPTYKVKPAHEKNRGNFGERNDTGRRNDYVQSSNYKNNADEYRHDIGHERNTDLRYPRQRTEVVTDDRDSIPSLKSNENNMQEMPALAHHDEFAKQIYIANLPHTVMQHQIYTLCKSRKVLHVDIFRTSSNITYAQVHVEGNSDVYALVKELNGYVVDNKKLVVMSLESILTERAALKKSQVASGRM